MIFAGNFIPHGPLERIVSGVIGGAENRAGETCGNVEVALRKTGQTMVQIAR